MEENNNGLLIKWVAIIIIVALGLEVYRTETTRKDLCRLGAVVNQLSEKIDSLEINGTSSGAASAAQTFTRRQFNTLSKSVSNLESKVSALQSGVERISRNLTQSGAQTRSSQSAASASKPAESAAQPSTSGSDPTETKATLAITRVTVSAKARMENRYMRLEHLPRVSTGPAGTVVINVTADVIGTVVAVSVNSASTISDEEILDACKEAALKTLFSLNSDAPDKQRGTITYTFTPKLR